jgi:4-amino-4-deoxy-L-arabinose transferase-like glycosyltransferase
MLHAPKLLPLSLLLLFWWRLLDMISVKSVTFDEVLHIFQGVLYWRKAELFSVVQNPPLINAMIGALVSALSTPTLPEFAPISDWLAVSKQFMWDLNSDGLQMIFAGRLVIIALALLLGALVYAWTHRLFSSRSAALFSLLLFSFDPNILAHSGLATTDLGTTFFFVLAAFCVWRYWRSPAARLGWYLAAGGAVGLAFAAKFSGLILVPALLLIGLYRLFTAPSGEKQPMRTVAEIAGWLVIAVIVFFALYRFEWQTFLLDYSVQQEHQLNGHSSYLFGELSLGTPLYFPVAFAVKTPLPLLLLLPLGLILQMGRRDLRWELFWPLLIALGVGGAALVSNVHIGYRYLLAAFPFLFVFLGGLARREVVKPHGRRFAALAAGWLILISLTTHPHYLAYFNLLGGGPENGWQILVDSNIDWGQDLIALRDYATANGIDTVFANVHSTAPLAAYRIPGEMLPGSLARKDADDLLFYDWFYPDIPQAGTYALSVTQLQGVYLRSGPDRFAWFREREPVAKAGYSIFIYEVPAEGARTGLGLSGLPIRAIAPADYQRLASNQVRPSHFDARTSFLWPGGGAAAVWTAVGDGHQPTNPLLQALYTHGAAPIAGEREIDETRWGYQLHHWPASPIDTLLTDAAGDPALITGGGWSAEPVVGAAEWEVRRREVETAVFADTVMFRGVQMGEAVPGAALDLLSFWEVKAPTAQSLNIFVHLLDSAGDIVAQHDGLDVRLSQTAAGDQFAQLHTIWLPADLPAGTYALQLGIYDRETFARLPLAVPDGTADRLLLHAFRID